MINPELIEASEETVKGEEGCLSFPDIYEDIERPKWVCVRYQDGSGKEWEKRLEGFGARVISHEMDHLDGVLMIDHLSHLKRKMLRKRLDIIREKAREIIQSLESGIPEA
jgi:peptide deformylase